MSLTISNWTYCQTKIDSFFIKKSFNNVVFISKDTLYKFTKIVQQDGVFAFTETPIDSILQNDQDYFSYFPKKTQYNKLVFNKLAETDTIYNYFSSKELNGINDELIFSYILKQLKEPKRLNQQQNFIRLLYPKDDLNPCKDYSVFTISCFHDSAKLYRILGRSYDSDGMLITKSDSVLLSQRDINRIKDQFSKVKASSVKDCRRPGI